MPPTDEAPGADEIEARVRDDIARHGWHAALVPPHDETPGWAFTIGLLERFGHPELAVFGPELGVVRQLLERVAREVARGRRFADGEEPGDLLVDQPLGLRRVEAKWIPVFFGNAAWHYRDADRPLELLQCFWPDPTGHLPWQEGADPGWRDDQPWLFLPETHRALSERLLDVLRREGAL